MGPVDIAIHNLGGSLEVNDVLAPPEEWERVWRFNVGVAIELNQILVPQMKKRSWGRLVHIVSSSAEHLNGPGPYAAAKAYLKAYVQILGKQLAPSGIVVSGLSPGAIMAHENKWEIRDKTQPELVQKYLSRHQSIGRLGRSSDLEPFALLLGSDLASFACGSVLPIHGG